MTGMIISIAVVLVLSASLWVAVDPVSRINTAKDSEREQSVLGISKALKDYVRNNEGQLPITGDIVGSKKVICGASATLTCAGDEKTCLTIDATTGFFDSYLPTLPVDPDKTSTADTGYYLTGDSESNLIVGSCDYEDTEITFNTRLKVTVVAEAGGCGGTEFEDYCWYLSDNLLHDCDDVCAGNGLNCVSGVVYDSRGDCSLHAAMGIGCSDDCIVTPQVYAPSILNPAYGFEYCYTDATNPVYYCGGYNYADFLILCACEAA